ncbi:MAG TPA: hypothetical protein VHK01_12630 [Lacipirellulaceae bacterium]|jgi:hypothetical protein|nr:hypothetical protein [Lacipirellulaceae bacterium]
MLTNDQREYVKLAVRPMQIIVAALATGVGIFFAIVFVIPPIARLAGGPPAEPLVSYIAAAAGLAGIFAWAVVPRIITAGIRQSIVHGKPAPPAGLSQNLPMTDERLQIRPLIAMYQNSLIVGGAILEGAAFFNLVAYMLEQQPMNLVVAGVLLLLLLSQIPTVSRLESWIETELTTIDQLRLIR